MSLILFYSQTYLRLALSEQEFGCSGVVNGLVCGVSESKHFLNDTNIFYLSHVMCANTWKINFKCCSSFFTAKRTSIWWIQSKIMNILGWWTDLFVQYQYQGTSWLIQKSFSPIWCVQTQVSLILFYSQTSHRLAILEQKFGCSGW